MYTVKQLRQLDSFQLVDVYDDVITRAVHVANSRRGYGAAASQIKKVRDEIIRRLEVNPE